MVYLNFHNSLSW